MVSLSRHLSSSAISFIAWDGDDATEGDPAADASDTTNADHPSSADNATGTLTVTFTGGNSYSYDNISRDEFEEFAGAASPGRHWHAVFKGR